MIEKRILDFYIDKRRRNYPTEQDLEKLNLLNDLFQHYDWIDRVSKDVYLNIMNYLGIPENDIEKYYNDYEKIKASFHDEYINIYPEINKISDETIK